MQGYVKKMRSKIGNDRFICPAARVIIENEQGEFLFIERVDNGNLGLPAGGIEEGETIEMCIIREAKEETGLDISKLQVIGISTHPQRELVRYPNGDETQYFSIEFYTKSYSGQLQADGIETKSLAFQSADSIPLLPENERATFESLAHYQRTGQVRLS